MSTHLYHMALSLPWCMTSDALDAMLAIASRTEIEPAEIARAMHGPRALATRTDHVRDDSDRLAIRNGNAILRIDGPIYRYADYFTNASGGVTTAALARDYQRALDDPSVTRIVLVIDSPGGESTGINELADLIYAHRADKETIAYIEGYGASAAYWIASAAEKIVIDDTALLGSIGTIMGVPDPTARPARTIDFVSSQSPNKRPNPTTDAGRAVLQTLVDDITEVFIENVMRNRGMTRDQVVSIAGGMLVGRHAIAAGLADELGSEESILATRAQPRAKVAPRSTHMAKVEPNDPISFANGETAEPINVVPAPAARSVGPVPADPRIAELESQLAALQASGIARDAERLAGDMIRAGKALPVQHAGIVALYTQLATDDLRNPQPSARTAVLQSFLESARVDDRTAERIQIGRAHV